MGWFEDVSRNGAGGRAARALLVTLLVVSAACSEAPPSARDSAAAARLHLDAGDPASALAELTDAMRGNPADPELRLLAARAYLAQHRGDLAEVALDQAVTRGLDSARALPWRARALLAQERYAAVAGLEVPASATAYVRLSVRLTQALAEAAEQPAGTVDDSLTRTFLDLFGDLRSAPDEPDVAPLRQELLALRESRPVIDRAWQHVQCAKDDPELSAWTPAAIGDRRVLRVGPGLPYATPADAAREARDGDMVEIAAGRYEGGVALWPQNGILIRGAGAGPHITAAGRAVRGRDVWLFTGDDVTVENVAISGARSADHNGAGIRHTGSGLTLRHVRLADNENGLLTGNARRDSRIAIEYSEFADNGDRQGQAHNIYVGRSASLTLRFSYSHGVRSGHLVKSRARVNEIAYNRLEDVAGTSSYLIDLPEGGVARILGNELRQGPETPNHGLISFAAEGLPHDRNELTFASNTVYNQHFRAVLIRNPRDAEVTLVNNLVGGAPVALADGPYQASGNLTLPDHGLADPRASDFHLTAQAPAIDAAVTGPTPEFEYVHPLQGFKRRPVWTPDVGAHERCGLR